MIICFNCTRVTKQQLEELIKNHHYEDYAEAIASAIENMVTIQNELASRSHLVLDVNAEVPFKLPKNERKDSLIREQTIDFSQGPPRRHSHVDPLPKPSRVPGFFTQIDIQDNRKASITDYPTSDWKLGETVPVHQWIFGQYNRLLPVKAGCRGFARLMKEYSDGLTFPEGPHRLASEATKLGDYLLYIDSLKQFSRDESLATAFPTHGDSVSKSQTRFANQFVAAVSKNEQLSSLAVDLKLVNWDNESRTHIKLTEAGWNYALMPNPILDAETIEGKTVRFNDDEIEFLLNHIALHVPREDFAYSVILDAILDGANTPSALDFALQKHIRQDQKRELSSSFYSSQRSGAVSRMVDLGLVQRIRDGVKVNYVVSPTGERYLGEVHSRNHKER